MRVIDSHTEGEPTRVIIEGGPDLGNGSLKERRALMAKDYDHVRRSLILEPRGSDVLVGALLCPPTDPSCDTGVIFFNNTGYLNMCGHGAIGVAVTLAHLGLVNDGIVKLETPVGIVSITMDGPNKASVKNVASYLYQADVTIDVDGIGSVTGDIAWGGNWFFLVQDWPFDLRLENQEQLTHYSRCIKNTLQKNQITGKDGEEIDHVELFGNPEREGANSKNFVLCPGDAYDRSPCGTGTSAKLACLAAKGQLQPKEVWVQDSIINSRFEAFYDLNDKQEIIPTITGRAYVYAEATILQHDDDPFKNGIVL
ncbi:MAG: proline racemase family protein [Kangiellaceae bacterium]|nr:proline racemase family protein [Kangiellaceae bacterium]